MIQKKIKIGSMTDNAKLSIVWQRDVSAFVHRAIQWNLNAQWTKNHLSGFIPKITFPKIQYVAYPEITGYGASLFAKLHNKTNSEEFYTRAVLAADALLALQQSSGAFPLSVDQSNFTIYSFDHIIITNGLLDCYFLTSDQKYLQSAEKAVNFLITHQKENGQIPTRIGMKTPSDYHFHLTKGTIPLLKMYQAVADSKYLKSAEKLATYLITKNQQKNGCITVNVANQTLNRYHFFCYAVEGLIAFQSFDSQFHENVEEAALYLLNSQREDGAIWYSFAPNGNPITDKVDYSATAQAARIFRFIYTINHDSRFMQGALQAINFLIGKQHLTPYKLMNGGLPFGYHSILDKVCVCSWATQFAADLAASESFNGFMISF
jgi:hypothetical protein